MDSFSVTELAAPELPSWQRSIKLSDRGDGTNGHGGLPVGDTSGIDAAHPRITVNIAVQVPLGQDQVWHRFGILLAGKAPVVVAKVAAGSDAEAAGLTADDAIVELNGKDARDASLEGLLELIRLTFAMGLACAGRAL